MKKLTLCLIMMIGLNACTPGVVYPRMHPAEVSNCKNFRSTVHPNDDGSDTIKY